MGRRCRAQKDTSKLPSPWLAFLIHSDDVSLGILDRKKTFRVPKSSLRIERKSALSYYKKFMNQGLSYFGDLDKSDGKLLEYEQEAEEEGLSKLTAHP